MKQYKSMARYVPHIVSAKDSVLTKCTDKVKEYYGDVLPKEVANRLGWELRNIEKHDTWMHFYVAEKLVTRAGEKGYLIGARGMVAASFVAYLLGITQINPLSAHYLCADCKYSEFFGDTEYDTSYDLPDRLCPVCHQPLQKEGFHALAETFFGFDGDKEPDINLSIPQEYRQELQNHLKEIFGRGNVITAIYPREFTPADAQEKIDMYQYKHNIELKSKESALVLNVLENMEDVCVLKKDMYFIIPPGIELEKIGPIYRIDEDNVLCLDWEMMSNCFYKLDILPSDSQTLLYRLKEETHVMPGEIPLDDKKVMAAFQDASIQDIYGYESDMAKEILAEIMPQTISDLIKVEGLLYSTGAWEDNGRELLKRGQAIPKTLIANRDDIYFTLLAKGIKGKDAYRIMEIVRKGRMHKDRRNESAEESLQLMRKYNIDDWYIESMENMYYLFPKGHSAAAAVRKYQLLWYRLYFPKKYEECMEQHTWR